MGNGMRAATSKVTSQNQISIPAEVRRRFAIVPGTELVWEEREGELTVHAKRVTLDDLRRYCAEHGSRRKMSLAQLRAARDHALKEKYGRR